jgi:hypothetical protein
MAADDNLIVSQAQAKWAPVPPGLPPGGEIAVLSGDPSKEGHFVILLRGPQGYKVPPHWHSTEENVTILSGTFVMGMSDDLDAAKGTGLMAGDYARMPAKMHHWAVAKTPVVIQVQAAGPFDIHYVHPEDNPAK